MIFDTFIYGAAIFIIYLIFLLYESGAFNNRNVTLIVLLIMAAGVLVGSLVVKLFIQTFFSVDSRLTNVEVESERLKTEMWQINNLFSNLKLY